MEKFFTTVDTKNGFWHVELDDSSSRLTTFKSPFGRFRWRRLPFGLCTAPEDFQRRHLVFGEGPTEYDALVDHDRNLRSIGICDRREQNIKLNEDKMKLRCEEVPFLGYLISKDGLTGDPAKIKAVLKMPTPNDVDSVHRLIGFINYLSKFLSRISDLYQFLRKLTLPEVGWFWSNLHDCAVQQVK